MSQAEQIRHLAAKENAGRGKSSRGHLSETAFSRRFCRLKTSK